MANTSSRTLRLLSLLQSQRSWPGPELAGRLGISVRTLRRDVDRLRDLGYPVHATRGVQGGYQLAAGASLPPLALDDEEAVALAVGLQAATSSAAAGIAEPSLRALAKVVQVMPPRLRRQVQALRAMTVPASWGTWGPGTPGPEPAVLLAAAQACRSGEGLTFDHTAAEGARTARRVEPHRLVCLGRRWYLVAYDLDRQAWRNFRLDRIGAMALDGRRFRQRELPALDAAAFVRQSFAAAPSNHDVRAVLACPAALARQRLGRWAQVQELPGEQCLLSMRTESLEWAAMALGSAGAEVSDVGPPQLVALLKDWSDRFARAGVAGHGS